MNKTISFIIATLTIASATVTFDASLRCSCEELSQTECTNLMMILYCKWTTSCESNELDLNLDFSCSSLPQAQCTPKGSIYQCAWEDSSCTSKSYGCSDFNDRESCPGALECYWNKSNKCDSFSTCADYEVNDCNHYGCYVKGGVCTEFQCSDFAKEDDCQGSDSESNLCAWSTEGKCNSITETTVCTDLSSYKSLCESTSGCKYEGTSCRYSACKDKEQEFACTTAKTGESELTLCTWSGSACIDATDATKLTQTDCFSKSSYNYRWTSESKCEECSDLVSKSISRSYILSLIFGVLMLFI